MEKKGKNKMATPEQEQAQKQQEAQRREQETQKQRDRERREKTGRVIDEEPEEVPIQDRTAQPENSFEELAEKLVQAKERYEEAEKKAQELGVGLDERREQRLKRHQEYQALLNEINRRANLDLNR